MSRIAEVAELKDQMTALSSDPVMESHGDISTLKVLLTNEQEAYQEALSKNGLLNSKLSAAKSSLANLQQQYDNLTVTKKNQEIMVAKLDSCLTDFNHSTSSSSLLGNELVQKLAGELDKSKEE